ncbi:MAG TPA: alpha/beta fold hydrolase [Gemmatimonas sp.]|nr:alpha/beta fold hydrolase [Gemmatimonas sp.]
MHNDATDEGLRFEIAGSRDDDRIPSILMVPPASLAPPHDGKQGGYQWPAALLLHGLSSDKERMASTVGRALRGLGVATLSIDLPLHGERRDADGDRSSHNPLALAGAWRRAQREAHAALDFLARRSDIDPGRIGLVGYSMGSFLGLLVASAAHHVRAVVLAAGGDLPSGTPFDRAMRIIADPLQAVQRVGGRPLLMVHGRDDRTVLPEQAQRLFDAAQEPKTMRWWDAGHYLPDAAITDASRWLSMNI